MLQEALSLDLDEEQEITADRTRIQTERSLARTVRIDNVILLSACQRAKGIDLFTSVGIVRSLPVSTLRAAISEKWLKFLMKCPRTGGLQSLSMGYETFIHLLDDSFGER